MSDNAIKQAVRIMAGTHNKTFTQAIVCSVSAVDIPSRTCTCTPLGGATTSDFTNVQMMAEVDDGILLVPAIDSTVIVCHSERNVPYIALYSELQKIFLIAVDQIELSGSNTVSQKAILGETLVNILGQLIDAIENITVDTPSGVSSVPLNSVDLESIKQSLFQCFSSIVKIG